MTSHQGKSQHAFEKKKGPNFRFHVKTSGLNISNANEEIPKKVYNLRNEIFQAELKKTLFPWFCNFNKICFSWLEDLSNEMEKQKRTLSEREKKNKKKNDAAFFFLLSLSFGSNKFITKFFY